jgi:integrase
VKRGAWPGRHQDEHRERDEQRSRCEPSTHEATIRLATKAVKVIPGPSPLSVRARPHRFECGAGSWKALGIRLATQPSALDFAEIEPNPARDRRVRLPRIEVEELTPPTAKQMLAILDNVASRWRLPFSLMEQTSLEPQPTRLLEVGDLDFAENKIRLRRKNVKGQRSVRARNVQVPG